MNNTHTGILLLELSEWQLQELLESFQLTLVHNYTECIRISIFLGTVYRDKT